MYELLFQVLQLILKLFNRSNAEFIHVIKHYNYRLVLYFIYTSFIVRIVQLCDLIEFVTKHVSILNVIQIYEKVYLEYSALNQVCRSFYGKSSLTNTRMSIKNEKIELIFSYHFHKFIKLLLPSHNRRVLHFFIVLSELRSRVINYLSSESNIFL